MTEIYKQDLDDQAYRWGNRSWRVSRLIALSADLEVMKIPLAHMSISGHHPETNSTMEFVEHVDRVNRADLSRPIILDEEGDIMDGRHRMMKALLKQKKYILAVRFKNTPDHCFCDASE